MIVQVKYPVALIATFLWIGFVCAISFMEAWLKFEAPGITLPLGLGIGRLVFNVLNKVEWVLAVAIIVNILVDKGPMLTFENRLYFVPLILLVIQTIWLLPAMDARAEMYMHGQNVPPSKQHFYYVGMEAVKVGLLFVFGIKLLKY